MALRPEPLGELLADAERVFVGEVREVLATGPEPANEDPAPRPGLTGRGTKAPEQRVRVAVTRLLAGAAAGELVLEKPLAPYFLRTGDRGVFFVRGSLILGRYGPDTYPVEQVEAALRR